MGDGRERAIDVRVIAATNRVLEDEIAGRKFRADLYWRLAQTSVRLPPLRERVEDLPQLAEAGLARVQAIPASAELIQEVVLRDREGNVRELMIACARASRSAADANATCVEARHLPPRSQARATAIAEKIAEDTLLRRRLTSKQVVAALQTPRGNVSLAAADLGVHRNTLHRYIVRYGIRME